MKLYLNKTSPYARLVVVVAREKALDRRLELVWTDPWASSPELLAVNPFSKVPALVTDDDVAIVESALICDYLDEIGGGQRLLPPGGAGRVRALRKYGLGRSLIDAAFGVTIQRRFHAGADNPELADRWLAALGRAVEPLRQEIAQAGSNGAADLGDLAIGVGLAYTAFRLPEVAWKQASPELAAWFDRIAGRESLRATAHE